MSKFSRLTLSAVLLGAFAVPALAQGGAARLDGAAPVTPRVVAPSLTAPSLRHHVVKPSRHVHHIAATDTVRTPAVTSSATVDGTKPGDARPGTVRTPAVAAAPVPAATVPHVAAPAPAATVKVN